MCPLFQPDQKEKLQEQLRHVVGLDQYQNVKVTLHAIRAASGGLGQQERPKSAKQNDQIAAEVVASVRYYHHADVILNAVAAREFEALRALLETPWVVARLKNEQSLAGTTAMHEACLIRDDGLIKFLEHLGYSKDVKDIDGRTPQDYYDTRKGRSINDDFELTDYSNTKKP